MIYRCFPQNCIIFSYASTIWIMDSWCGGRTVEEQKHNKTSTLIQKFILYIHKRTYLCAANVYYKSTSHRMWCKEAECEYNIMSSIYCMPAEQRRIIILWMLFFIHKRNIAASSSALTNHIEPVESRYCSWVPELYYVL